MGKQFMVIACGSGMSQFKENVSFGAKNCPFSKGGGVMFTFAQRLFLLL